VPLNLDTILGLSGVFAEAIVVILCIRTKLFRLTPVFFSYLVWSTFVDIALYSAMKHWSARTVQIYFIEMIVDSVFQFAVLVELEWAVLRPIRASLPKHSIIILALLVLAAGAVIWPVARWVLPPKLTAIGMVFVQLQQTIAALRVVFFMAMAAFSQLLSIGWRNRELQIATGLGFYSMFSLAIALIHAHQSVGHTYHLLDALGTASYVCSLVYWIVSFAQQEEERQEFTPQMRSFLLAVTGAARGTRMALADSGIGTSPKVRKP
jgi:hypothetical protein